MNKKRVINMKKSYIQWMRTGLMGIAVALTCQACSDWDDHYDDNSGSLSATSGNTLWENMSLREDLSDFQTLLKKAGYDEVLNTSQVYTVWAPLNGEFDFDKYNQMDLSTLEKEFIQNHVARFSYVASGNIYKRILMLNSKSMQFEGGSTGYMFENTSVNLVNVSSKNGVLHVLDGSVAYFPNLWEMLAIDEDYSHLHDYLHSFDELILDTDASVPGGSSENGELTYLDSVMVNWNEMFWRLGYMEREDSSYTMVLLTNKAWDDATTKLEKYFDYTNTSAVIGSELKDSMQNYWINRHLVDYMMFNNNRQPVKDDILRSDSLITTTGYVLYPEVFMDYFANATQVEASNGFVYIQDSLRLNPTDAWHQPIIVEAEYPTGRKYEYGAAPQRINVTSLTQNPKVEGRLSNSAYMYMEVEKSGAPKVTFKLPRTLSANYKVKCVVVPANITDSLVTPKPSILRFSLSGALRNPLNITVSGNVDLEKSPYDYTKVDTITLTNATYPDGVIPFRSCEYGLTNDETKVELAIQNMSGTNAALDRNLRIDCIILEPVDEE